jgi:hypothetical protein
MAPAESGTIGPDWPAPGRPPGQHLPRNWPIGTARKYRKLLEEKN